LRAGRAGIGFALLAGVLSLRAEPQPSDEDETLINVDIKDVNADGILRLLAEVGGFNLVMDPDVECRLTLSLKAVRWQDVYKTVLRSCRLGEDRIGENLVRVAGLEQLARELEERRRYEEQKQTSAPRRTTFRRLAYARAKDIAPLVRKFLSPRGEVNFDERTNTLIITDVGR
jgi:type IV pilus assembly protein PilQ